MKVPIVGGVWDGAHAIIESLPPGARMTLDGVVHEVAWVEGSPRLVPVL